MCERAWVPYKPGCMVRLALASQVREMSPYPEVLCLNGCASHGKMGCGILRLGGNCELVQVRRLVKIRWDELSKSSVAQ